jgi:hypothetical protein
MKTPRSAAPFENHRTWFSFDLEGRFRRSERPVILPGRKENEKHFIA